MTTKKVMSTRIEPKLIATARDGLMRKNFKNSEIDSISSILRLTFYYGLSALLTDLDQEPSKDSLIWIQQKVGQHGKKTNLSLKDILKN